MLNVSVNFDDEEGDGEFVLILDWSLASLGFKVHFGGFIVLLRN